MHTLLTILTHLDPLTIIRTSGYLGLAIIIFAESGIIFGIFFPGDSLLFVAGLLAANGFISLLLAILTVIIAAVLGDSVGYWFGNSMGSRLYARPDSRFFKHEYLERTEKFYQRYGGRAIVLARFVPIVRTIAPILAGVSSMRYRSFLIYNILGAILWGAGVVLIGFSLGSIFPNSEQFIFPIALGIIAMSFLPIALNMLRTKRASA